MSKFKPPYLSEFLRYGPDFWHDIITFIDFKITFSNIGSFGAPSFISGLCQIDKYENEDNLTNEDNLKNEVKLKMNNI